MQQKYKERHPAEGLIHRFWKLNQLWEVVSLKVQQPHHGPSLSEAFHICRCWCSKKTRRDILMRAWCAGSGNSITFGRWGLWKCNNHIIAPLGVKHFLAGWVLWGSSSKMGKWRWGFQNGNAANTFHASGWCVKSYPGEPTRVGGWKTLHARKVQ